MSMQRLMEIDYAMRAAAAAQDGEAVNAMVKHQEEILTSMVERDPDDVVRLGRQIADILERNLELARRAREALRAELNSLDRRRKIIGDGRATRRKPAQRRFSA